MASVNSSLHSLNVSSLTYRDPSSTAVAKNVIVLALGLTINYINGTLIHTFRKHQIFYTNPRYVLFIHLVLNDMIQLTVTICLFVLSYIFYTIHTSLCCIIISFAIFTTLNTPLNLAVMAVECYIAICLPLRHAEFCTIKRTYMLIGWIWALSVISTLPDVFLNLAAEPVRYFYTTIFCERDNLFRHPISLEKRDISYIIYLAAVWMILFFTYFKIFFTAKAAKDTKSGEGNPKKARNTILLHGFQLLMSMLAYMYHEIIKALVYWFPQHYIHVIFICYISIQILPRLISPIVYGLRDKTFRRHLKKYLLFSARADDHVAPWTSGTVRKPMTWTLNEVE